MMKKEIILIGQQLSVGDITETEAIKELLLLLGVGQMLRRIKNHSNMYGYPSKSFRIKLNKFIKKYC